MFYNTDFLKNNEIYLKLYKTANANPEKNWVPAYYFKICLNTTDEEIGTCDLRIGHNKGLYYGGNIGYGVDEQYRGNHYAAKACKLLFQLARKHELQYLIITCNPDNYSSRKTCEYLGGILKEIIDLPKDNDMFLQGERQECIYEFIL
ncbi:GNAT family N-acetyltransferase [Clostridium frigidicarnis]|uniref:Acetyltransferase (GNAT) domain-containing protein n=1 Tax=Clostridium frigidicarnis TaxID=84698 RepID=A0A1I0VUW1_9CLOT|nr:GNAT family N-acetyltransferase [Clostridium frigidicarnis]SFA79700.1 Acetyltransferase (GNAT) domain-containing protein [Clostridium frigidicarnis]